jgi:hypothetical protein
MAKLIVPVAAATAILPCSTLETGAASPGIWSKWPGRGPLWAPTPGFRLSNRACAKCKPSHEPCSLRPLTDSVRSGRLLAGTLAAPAGCGPGRGFHNANLRSICFGSTHPVAIPLHHTKVHRAAVHDTSRARAATLRDKDGEAKPFDHGHIRRRDVSRAGLGAAHHLEAGRFGKPGGGD